MPPFDSGPSVTGGGERGSVSLIIKASSTGHVLIEIWTGQTCSSVRIGSPEADLLRTHLADAIVRAEAMRAVLAEADAVLAAARRA